MRRAIVVRPEASADANEAAHWYDQRVRGLGTRFLSELDSTFRAISDIRIHYSKYYGEIRRVRVRNFPYGVFFAEAEAKVVALAIIHLSRDPRLIRRTLRRR